MKKGRMGMTTRTTISTTMRWNSSSTSVTTLARAQVAASPSRTESTRADITDMMGAISRLNSSSGSLLRPSAADWMDRAGMMA